MLDRLRKPPQALEFNMTPMIDVVFLLIIFFMLASQFVSAEHAELKLPQPDDSKAREIKLPEKVVINVQVGTDGKPRVLIGPRPCADLEELFKRLQVQKAETPDVQVVLRADRRVHYEYIRDVMRTIADSEIQKFNIAAKREPE